MYKIEQHDEQFLLRGDKSMPKMRQDEFIYSVSGLFTKNKARIRKFKEAGDSRFIYRNESDKDCFQYDLANDTYKDLPKRKVSDNVVQRSVKHLLLPITYRMMSVSVDLHQRSTNS